MRHCVLTCKNHPELRWSSKETAVNKSGNDGLGAWNGSRHIFFNGTPLLNADGSPKMFDDNSGLDCTTFKDGKHYAECACSPSDLILAPEDILVKRYPGDTW